MVAYKLFQSLAGHESDVRGVCIADVGVVTTSRDKTARIWTENADRKFSETLTLVGHTNYVGPVLQFPPGLSPSLPNGAIVTGSRDTTVIVWDTATGDKIHILTGHQYQVAALTIASDGCILSGSLDKTIRAWKDGECVRVLEGHEGPVLSLLTLPDGDILSGSGDTTIRRWSAQSGQCIATYKGHRDTVRALALLPGVGFVSASHDHTLKVWTGDGQMVSELLGHTAIIYAVSATESGLIASGSEDNTVRIWRADGSCLQTLTHPGCLWDVAFTPSEDLIAACSDALSYVWTASNDKPEDTEALKALEAAIATRSKTDEAAAQGRGGEAGLPPGLKVEKKYVLLERGSKDGETKVVKEGDGSVWAYSWNQSALQWEKIGEVVSAPAGRTAAQDGDWDYSFDVDISDDSPNRRLVGKFNENPYDVADRFLEQEGLPAYFRDQVVSFILQNTGGKAAGLGVSNMPITGGFCDPYTGGSTCTSQPIGAPAVPQPAPMTFPMDITGGGADPYTGSQSSSGGGASTSQYLPYKGYMLFDSPPPLPALTKKLREFNTALRQTGQPCALSEEELGACESLLSRITPSLNASPPSQTDLSVLTKLLSFSKDHLFIVLDITRMLILDPTFAPSLAPYFGSLSSPTPGTLAGALSTAMADPPLAPAQQTGARLICNCFKQDALRGWLASNVGGVLDLVGAASSSSNKHVRQAVATALLNFAVMLNGGQGKSQEVQLQLMGAVSELLGGDGVLQQGETAFRALAAAGTLASSDKEMAFLARDLGLDSVAGQLMAQAGAPPKVMGTAQALRAVLSS